MSPAHCCAVQMAFDRIVEQPTERSPTWDCKQARTCPWPGFTPAHRELTSVVQSRSEVNNPSCAPALPAPLSSNAAPSAIVGTLSAIIEDDFNMVAFLWVILHPAPPIRADSPFFSFSASFSQTENCCYYQTKIVADLKLTQVTDRDGDPTMVTSAVAARPAGSYSGSFATLRRIRSSVAVKARYSSSPTPSNRVWNRACIVGHTRSHGARPSSVMETPRVRVD